MAFSMFSGASFSNTFFVTHVNAIAEGVVSKPLEQLPVLLSNYNEDNNNNNNNNNNSTNNNSKILLSGKFN